MSTTFFNHSRGIGYHQPRRSMTSEWRGFIRKSKGSMVTRSVEK